MTGNMNEAGTATVFISYASLDAHLAQQVRTEFEEHGLLCWVDSTGIAPGASEWWREVEEAIDRATCVVVLWTPNSVGHNNKWVYVEAQRAHEQGKLQQLLVDKTKPPFPFGGIQGIRCSSTNGDIEREPLRRLVNYVRGLISLKGPNERILQPRKFGEQWDCEDLALRGPVPGTDIFVSFHPCNSSGVFSRVRAGTTEGWVSETIRGARELHAPFQGDPTAEIISDTDPKTRFLRTKNEIFFINDPMRPYSIQIGRLRSRRTPKIPKYIDCHIEAKDLRHIGLGDPGMCELLAAVLDDETALEALWDAVEANKGQFGPDAAKRIHELIARNPNSPKEYQHKHCIFCSQIFKEALRTYTDTQLGAYVLENSFPFGPYFHYVVITLDAIHSWEDLQFRHVRAMNVVAHKYVMEQFSDQNSPVRQAAGIEFGFNSTVKHLVLGRRTHTSAGASIPHIHKQFWGMAPRTSNLAEQLILVSDAYWRQGIDYQSRYYSALSTQYSQEEYGYVLWEDNNVVLYVPYGQCSMHETQVMTLEPRANIIELNREEMESISKAEYITLRIYKELGVTSFNQIILSKLFNDHRAPRFRLVMAFITREVDLAMSELSMLYVVDQHPWDSCKQMQTAWKQIKEDVLAEIKA